MWQVTVSSIADLSADELSYLTSDWQTAIERALGTHQELTPQQARALLKPLNLLVEVYG